MTSKCRLTDVDATPLRHIDVSTPSLRRHLSPGQKLLFLLNFQVEWICAFTRRLIVQPNCAGSDLTSYLRKMI